MTITKKIFFFSLFVFCLSLLLWGVYVVAFKRKISPQSIKKDALSTIGKVTKQKLTNENEIIPIIKDKLISATLSSDGRFILYFSQADQKFYQTNLDGTERRAIEKRKFNKVVGIKWSPDKQWAILKVKMNNNNQYYVTNFKKDSYFLLKKNLDEVAWGANSNKIFYKYFNSQNHSRTLNIANVDGSNWKELANLKYRRVVIKQIPKTGLISFWNQGDANQETFLQSKPIIGGQTDTLFNGNFGADYLWSPSGNYVLVSHTNQKGGYKMQLAVMNYKGGEYHDLDIPTFVSKCVWSKDEQTVYYALPGGIDNHAILPNDYKESKVKSVDTFWKVNITTTKKTRLISVKDIKKEYDASQMFLNQDESLLFFINKVDRKLYRISL